MRGITKIPVTTVTPEMATLLLEKNKQNRPLSQSHVHRIASEITMGRWQYNGDTIKIANDDSVLDGQHRLWAVIEANKAIETIVVNGIDPAAFTTVDAVRKLRTASDTVALCGYEQNRHVIAMALTWLIRWHTNTLSTDALRKSGKRIENEDIRRALADHPNIVEAVKKTTNVRRICNNSIIACFYYILCCQKREALADLLVESLIDPTPLPENHPFLHLRRYFLSGRSAMKTLSPPMSFALLIKATNAVANKQKIALLRWQNQGRTPEAFPVLKLR